jgi:hypothetical protein
MAAALTLHDQMRPKAIDDEATEPIRFAENQAAGRGGSELAEVPAQAYGLGDPLLPERDAEQSPGGSHVVESDADAAGTVVDPAGNEVVLLGDEIDEPAIGRAGR